MRAVDIGIGHHDDLVVSGLFDVEACAGSCADHLDDGCAFLVGQHLRERCLLHVEYFASNRQQRLETGITGGLGCAQCGITLDDEQFGHIVIAGLAVGQFRRHGRGFKRVLTACDFLGLARLHAGMHFADDFLQHAAGLFLVTAFGAGNHLTELLIGHSGDDRLDLRGAEHVLGLALELRFGDADGDDGHQTGENVVTFHLHMGILEIHLEFARVVLDGLAHLLGDALEEAVHVHAAAGRLHHVDEAAHGGVVAVGPSHGDIDCAITRHLLRMQFTIVSDRLRFFNIRVLAGDAPNIGDRFAFGQEVDEILHASGMAEFFDARMRIFRLHGLGNGFLRLRGSIVFLRFG